jgi:hypothetical protein
MNIINTFITAYEIKPVKLYEPKLKNQSYIKPFISESNNGVTYLNDCNGRYGYLMHLKIKCGNKVVYTAMTIHNRLANDITHVIYYGPRIIYNGKYVRRDDYNEFFDIINDLLFGKKVFFTNGKNLFEVELMK